MIEKRVMRRWLVGVGAAVMLVGLLAMRSAAPAAAANTAWTATYWNNRTLNGTAVLQRQESDLNYDWGDGAPDLLVNADQFSARWTRTLNVPEGSYRFTATLDDGMRVWVDNALIIDSWTDSQVRAISKDVYLTSGDHQLKVEYYEAGGKAVAKLAWAPISGPAPVPIGRWKGEYFNNSTLSGSPAVVRDDERIDFDWGGGSPVPASIGADQFSVRWTRTLTLDPGKYRFTVAADDGVRLWVNGRLLIDQWHDANTPSYSADIDLPGGAIPVQLEYYENQGGAFVRLTRTFVSGGSGWTGEYFNNQTLSGVPVLTRNDAQINFNWGGGSPATGINADGFSVRWTRSLSFVPGRYRFSVLADDGVRLWVNGQLVINAWSDHTPQTFTGDITLPGSAVPLQLEYYENTGGAQVQLSWTAVSTEPPVQPPAPVGSGTGTVRSARLNVRTGPGLQFNVLGQLAQGQSVSLTGYRSADGNWATITYNGVQAWISARPAYLQTTANVAGFPVWQGTNTGGPPATTPTGRVTAAYYLNVRSGPFVGNNVLTTIPNGTIVELLGRNASAGWIKVRLTGGTVGWVSGSYLSSTTPFSTLAVVN